MKETRGFGAGAACLLLLAAVTAAAMAARVPMTGENMSEVRAVEFTVDETTAVLYSNEKTKVYNQPDINSGVVTAIAKDVPVDVTGITSNGWFRVSIKGTYYIPGDGLVSKETPAAAVPETDIVKLTKGTFSFFKNPQLGNFDKNDVADMDMNTYIKYLDSFLMGYALPDRCIMQESGRLLKEVYESEAKADQKVAGMTLQAYLLNYRNNYLIDSLKGPFRNEKDLKQALNRAIRYNIDKFGTVYRNSGIGSDESRIERLMESVTDAVWAEQGVTFAYTAQYGSYKAADGSEGKGWSIEFTKKD